MRLYLQNRWARRESCVPNKFYRVRTGFGKSWKVLEIDNGFFQDLESFGNLIFGPLGYGKVMDFL
jgi:hypothetical protein